MRRFDSGFEDGFGTDLGLFACSDVTVFPMSLKATRFKCSLKYQGSIYIDIDNITGSLILFRHSMSPTPSLFPAHSRSSLAEIR